MRVQDEINSFEATLDFDGALPSTLRARSAVTVGNLSRVAGSKRSKITWRRLQPAQDADNRRRCKEFFKRHDKAGRVPRAKLASGRCVYLVTPRQRRACRGLRGVLAGADERFVVAVQVSQWADASEEAMSDAGGSRQMRHEREERSRYCDALAQAKGVAVPARDVPARDVSFCTSECDDDDDGVSALSGIGGGGDESTGPEEAAMTYRGNLTPRRLVF